MPKTREQWVMLVCFLFILLGPFIRACSEEPYEDCDYIVNHGCE
jgi:hypothetical protein